MPGEIEKKTNTKWYHLNVKSKKAELVEPVHGPLQGHSWEQGQYAYYPVHRWVRLLHGPLAYGTGSYSFQKRHFFVQGLIPDYFCWGWGQTERCLISIDEDVTRADILFLILVSMCSLLLYRNIIYICTFFSYSVTTEFTSLFSEFFCGFFCRFYIMSHTVRKSYFFFFYL